MSKTDYKDKDWLVEQYVEKEKAGTKIAKEQRVNHSTIYYWIEKHNIEKRSISESKLGDKHPFHNTERDEFAEKMSGENNPAWKGGVTKERDFRKQSRWQKFTEQLKQEVGWECENCGEHGSNAEIQTHHAKPISQGGEKFDNTFIVLCKECHGNSSSKWHNMSVNEQMAEIGGEPKSMFSDTLGQVTGGRTNGR